MVTISQITHLNVFIIVKVLLTESMWILDSEKQVSRTVVTRSRDWKPFPTWSSYNKWKKDAQEEQGRCYMEGHMLCVSSTFWAFPSVH